MTGKYPQIVESSNILTNEYFMFPIMIIFEGHTKANWISSMVKSVAFTYSLKKLNILTMSLN